MKCIKCGCTDIGTSYHSSIYSCRWGNHNREDDEHLHLTCRKCQYDWCEPTKDQLENKGDTK